MNEKRNIAIDFVKGVCVLAMLLHHSINYFPLNFPLIKYVRFVTAAFIFITGFIVTHYYLKKYIITDKKIYIRLFIRALKLIVIFTLTNIARVNLTDLIPVTNAMFHFFAYGFFTVVWIRYIYLFLSPKAPGIKWIVTALALPMCFLLSVKSFSVIIGKEHRWIVHDRCSNAFVDLSPGLEKTTDILFKKSPAKFSI